jgi:transcriptional regulator with XRE-family HTH domain
MAEKMGISQPQYCRLERDGNLSVEQLVQISMILDTTVEELTKNHKACKHINL